jgi:DNA-binding MarR family transcriptional regulator
MNEIHNIPSRGDAATEGLALLFTLAARLGDAMDRGLLELGLTRARAEVIWVLHQQSPLTQRELSQALRCSPRNITGLLDALQATGFVARDPHPSDRRATLVSLTDQGSATASAWRAEYDQFGTLLFADLSTPELTSFVATLGRVLTQLPADAAAATPIPELG